MAIYTLWDIEVNGILYDLKAGYDPHTEDWRWMEDLIPDHPELKLMIEADYDNGLILSNKTQEFLRVKLIPSRTLSSFSTEISGNPTYGTDTSTGIISFCLAPGRICIYTAISTVPITDEEGFYNFPWFRVNTAPVNSAGETIVIEREPDWTQLESLLPVSNDPEQHPSSRGDGYYGDVIAQLSTLLNPHGITVEEIEGRFVKLTSTSPIYLAPIDYDGGPIGMTFDIIGRAPSTCDVVITCEGATPSSNCITLNGRFDVKVDGRTVLYNVTDGEVRQYFDDHPEYSTEDCIDPDALPFFSYTDTIDNTEMPT